MLLILRLAAAVGALLASAALAEAEDWPTRPVTMVVPFAAGGPADAVGRILASHLSDVLGQEVVVENVGGGGGMLGGARVARAAPDGYQFVLGNMGTHAANQTLYKTPLYNAASDFAPVTLVAETPLLLLTREAFPADTLPQFVSYARANQVKMQFGSGGAGSASHLACLLVNLAMGIKVTHVPYRGAAPAMQDLIAGRIDYQCPDSPTSVAQIEGGNVKALAVLTAERSGRLPDVPTAREQGLEVVASNWFAIFCPKGTPAGVVEKLRAAISASMDTPSLQARMRDIGAELPPPERRTPAYLQTFVAGEIAKWAAPIKQSGAIIE
ncbi:MAG: tripartite tricarboxylate transporter substrate binding protein BugD [Bradyrhizobiaceae bacterium]|nr:tripartite tricarboxylate transporter substrate binding protein BugD [Hyphomicrobiales bacterium]MBV9428978.1 tripartite tricarboxylate transporter substrate binding protein BugD [Bradyrhizobiaceae bacterium]